MRKFEQNQKKTTSLCEIAPHEKHFAILLANQVVTILCREKHKLFVTVHSTVGQASWADILNPDDGGLAGDANIFYKTRIFSLADMLAVKLSIL